MDAQEVRAFCDSQRTCRVATVGADSTPHVAPLWFVWDGQALWLHSLTRAQRFVDLQRNPRVSAVVDDGETYGQLRGVEFTGRASLVGAVPAPTASQGQQVPELAEVERLWSAKYLRSTPFGSDGRHVWIKVVPRKVVSWDFRKNASLHRPSEQRPSDK